MTKEEFMAYIEEHGEQDRILETAKVMKSEGVKISREELDKRLGYTVQHSSPAVEEFKPLPQDAFETKPVQQSLWENESRPMWAGGSPVQGANGDRADYNIGGYTEKLKPKELRAHARSDIEWGTLMWMIFKMGFIYGIVSGIGSYLGGLTGGILSIPFGLISLVLSAIMSAGITRSELDLRRNAEPSGLFGAINVFLPYLGATVLYGLMMGVACIPIFVAAVVHNSVVSIIASIISIALIVFLMLTYGQYSYFCVDGMGVIESLHESRIHMSGNRLRYFLTILPLAGWSILAYIAIYATIFTPIILTSTRSVWSALAMVMMVISAIVVTLMTTLPLSAYSGMIGAEFYDNLIGKKMRQIQKKPTPLKKAIIWTIVLVILSSASVFAPIWQQNTSLTDMLTSTVPGATYDSGTSSGTYDYDLLGDGVTSSDGY